MISQKKLSELKGDLDNAMIEFNETIKARGVGECASGMGLDKNYLSGVINGHFKIKVATFFGYYKKLLYFLDKKK